jgi:hypothetical protein
LRNQYSFRLALLTFFLHSGVCEKLALLLFTLLALRAAGPDPRNEVCPVWAAGGMARGPDAGRVPTIEEKEGDEEGRCTPLLTWFTMPGQGRQDVHHATAQLAVPGYDVHCTHRYTHVQTGSRPVASPHLSVETRCLHVHTGLLG